MRTHQADCTDILGWLHALSHQDSEVIVASKRGHLQWRLPLDILRQHQSSLLQQLLGHVRVPLQQWPGARQCMGILYMYM